MKRLVLLATLFASMSSFAGEFQDLYITHAGCRVYEEGRDLDSTKDGIQSLEIWIHLSEISAEYNPEKNIRAYINTEDSLDGRRRCEELYSLYKSKKKATFKLKKHPHWDDSKIVEDFAAGLTDNFSSREIEEKY